MAQIFVAFSEKLNFIKQDKTLQVEIVDMPEEYLEKNKFLENVQLLNVNHEKNYTFNYLVIEMMVFPLGLKFLDYSTTYYQLKN